MILQKCFQINIYIIINSPTESLTFFDITTGKKYEAKILFYHQMCYEISNNGVESWIKYLVRETEEIFEHSKTDQAFNETMLYKDMESRINSIKKDEGGILFFPFSITNDCEESRIYSFGKNNFKIVYDALIENNKGCVRNEMYIIYPTLENKTVIMDLNSAIDNKEFLTKNYLEEYYTHIIE